MLLFLSLHLLMPHYRNRNSVTTHCCYNFQLVTVVWQNKQRMSSERLLHGGGSLRHQTHVEPLSPLSAMMSTLFSFAPGDTPEPSRIFEELPKATIISVCRPDAADYSPVLLSYTIEFSYKQFKWLLVRKASDLFYLHFALKKRLLLEEIHEKQGQVKDWLQNLGIGEHTHEDQGDDTLDDTAPLHHDESVRNRDVPSSAALSLMKPALGRQYSMSDRARVTMQEYLNHFLGNLDIVNSREVCSFLEVSTLSFSPEYGPKLREDFVMVKHLPKIVKNEDSSKCCSCCCFDCFNENWQKVWAVLKPGFLAFLGDPFDTKPLDIMVFDVLPLSSDCPTEGLVSLAVEVKERNPLRHAFKVTCGSRSIRLRTKSAAKVKDWITAINSVGLSPPEGWCHFHRFGSYAPIRGLSEDGSMAQWFIDGRAAFDAIASAIEDAKSEIFICGWWVCPELYLRRPFRSHASSRLDALLEVKANEGVQIYILLYKEVSLALKINSAYSKRKFLSIHPNVRVLRYPDHFSSGVYLWSHHEKLVIVDHQVCFIGGLDLCFGRYDTSEHKVGDNPPLVWPGKDYYNPRESEPNSWEDMIKDELDRQRYPRMPWHDVHCALWGPPCRDVARHFVQRWNYAKRNKALHEETIPLLMPQHHMVIPHYMGESDEKECKGKDVYESRDITRRDSVSPSSSSQDIPLLLPQEAEDLNDGNTSSEPNGLNRTPKKCSSFSFRKLKIEPYPEDTPFGGFLDDFNSSYHHPTEPSDARKHSGGQNLDHEWWEMQERGDWLGSVDETGQVGPCTSCRCQVLRSVSQWSAGTCQIEDSIHRTYCSLIEKAEHFVYIENQFFISGLAGDELIRNRVLEALYRRIMQAYHNKKCFRAIIVIPLLPGFQGGIDDGGAASVRAIMHWQYRTICRGRNSILSNLSDLLGPRVHDYISFYGLRAYGKLFESGSVATSQVYVHSKIMIIDDCTTLIGSANINDRSLLGSRDSEIGVLIEDKELIDSRMGGKPWKAGKFALSLRLSLWSEHLGILQDEMSRIIDPICDASYKDMWMATAKENSTIYQEVFSCVPNDLIRSRVGFRQSMSSCKEKTGHSTIDLGIIAPEKLEARSKGEVKKIDRQERLKFVRGHLVSFPLDFMRDEDLRPVFKESEFYASPQVFH